jgi:hypothetical protein
MLVRVRSYLLGMLGSRKDVLSREHEIDVRDRRD